MVAARVEVVVVAVDARLLERARLVVGQQPQTRANLQRQLLLDLTNRRGHLPELTLARTPPARDDAVRAGPARPGFARAVEQDVAGEQLVLRYRRSRDDRLRAVATVL